METWVMVVVGVMLFALPVVLMAVFNGRDRADARGRRVDQTWRVRRPAARRPTPPGT